MRGLGSGADGEWTFLDILNIISFCVGLQNLDLNISQENLDNQTQELDAKLREVVDNIHQHLTLQDQKINKILEVIGNDKNQEVS
jgi:hypothetical protein